MSAGLYQITFMIQKISIYFDFPCKLMVTLKKGQKKYESMSRIPLDEIKHEVKFNELIKFESIFLKDKQGFYCEEEIKVSIHVLTLKSNKIGGYFILKAHEYLQNSRLSSMREASSLEKCKDPKARFYFGVSFHKIKELTQSGMIMELSERPELLGSTKIEIEKIQIIKQSSSETRLGLSAPKVAKDMTSSHKHLKFVKNNYNESPRTLKNAEIISSIIDEDYKEPKPLFFQKMEEVNPFERKMGLQHSAAPNKWEAKQKQRKESVSNGETPVEVMESLHSSEIIDEDLLINSLSDDDNYDDEGDTPISSNLVKIDHSPALSEDIIPEKNIPTINSEKSEAILSLEKITQEMKLKINKLEEETKQSTEKKLNHVEIQYKELRTRFDEVSKKNEEEIRRYRLKIEELSQNNLILIRDRSNLEKQLLDIRHENIVNSSKKCDMCSEYSQRLQALEIKYLDSSKHIADLQVDFYHNK